MSIDELVKDFGKGATSGKASNGRVRIEGDNLVNYYTIIATRTSEGVILNNKHYSQTTTKLQNKIRYYCNVIKEYEGENATIIYAW